MNRVTYVTELYPERYTKSASPQELVGRRVRVLNDELNRTDQLGAWFVTGLDPKNTAYVLVTQVNDFRAQTWSVHHAQLRCSR